MAFTSVLGATPTSWTSKVTGTGAGASGAIGGSWGADLASAGTITVTDPFHNVTGTATVSTIEGGSKGKIYVLVSANGFSVNTAGNVNFTGSVPAGSALVLVYDGVTYVPASRPGALTQAEADARYAKTATGNTLTGDQVINGKLGVGAAPLTAFEVYGPGTAYSARHLGIRIFDTTPIAAGVGAGIALGGKVTSSGTYGELAGVTSLKSNAVSGDYTGELVLWTSSSSGGLTERARIDGSGRMKLASSLFERGRSSAMGEWTAFTPSLGSTGTGSVSGGSVEFARYTLIGKTLTVNLTVTGITVTGTVNALKIPIPGGYSASATQRAHVAHIYENGAYSSGAVTVSGAYLYVHKQAWDTNSTPLSTNLHFAISFAFEIQ